MKILPETPHAQGSQTSLARLSVIVFVVAGLVLFLESSRRVNIFDEGIALTNSMRVAAGQAIHRDFFYQYGPANVYMVAGLFKAFGQSALIERIVNILEAASMVAVLFALLNRFAGLRIALAAVVLCLLWSESLSWMTLTLVLSTWLIAENFAEPLSRVKAFYAGLLAGVTILFRYDAGGAAVIGQVLLLFAASFLRTNRSRPALREAGQRIWPYLAGVALLIVPLLIWYTADGILPGLVFDVWTYSSKYYYAGRHLPFPRVHRKNFEDVVVYVFPLLIALPLFYVLRYWRMSRRRDAQHHPIPRWLGPVLSFALIAAIGYSKAVVRMGAYSLQLSTPLCIVLGAVLLTCRRDFKRSFNAAIGILLTLFVLAGLALRWHSWGTDNFYHSSMTGWIVARSSQAPFPPFRNWCTDGNPVSKGPCYFVDNDHIQTIQYLTAHTQPGDTLYVGLPHHDRVYAGDDVTYFATQRLPAVNWDQLDPYLQNMPDIQTQMIQEIEKNRPPYIALDSEFRFSHEPNGSSLSTGVHLLDDYIAANYSFAARFGEMTILRRNQ